MKYSDREASTIGELLQFIAADLHDLDSSVEHQNQTARVWFRGLKRSSYELLPTLYHQPRRLNVAAELGMLNRFKQNAPQAMAAMPDSEDDYGWLLLARHHGLPSRLLDWTESPLIGLYFALESEQEPAEEEDAAIWCLLPEEMNRGMLGSGSDPLPMFAAQAEIFSQYLPDRVRQTPGNIAAAPLACLAPRISSRLQSQQAVFTIHHAAPTPLERHAPEHLWRYIVPIKHKQALREQVRLLGMNRRVLFPDLDTIATDAREGF